VNEDLTFNPRGNGSGKLDATLKPGGAVNPRAMTGAGGVGGIVPGGHPVPSQATIRGAFFSTGDLWTTGWSALNLGGILAN
jgi:hypothetical protein